MSSTTLPVEPLTEDEPVERIPESGELRFDGFRVSQQVYSGAFAKKLDITMVGEVTVDLRSAVVEYDAMLFSEREEVENLRGQVIATRWGAGVQLRVAVTNVAADFEVSLLSAAVAADAQIAQARYEIRALGISDRRFLEELTGSQSGVGAGTFDLNSFQTITRAIDRAREHMASAPDLKPVLFNTNITPDHLAEVTDEAASVVFALRRIASRDPLDRALKLAGERTGISSRVVEAVYRRLIQNAFTTPGFLDVKPTREEAERAERWLEIE